MKAKIVMVDQQHFSMARDPKPNVLRIRIDHTPEEGEPMYGEQHIQVPIIPPEGYPGEVFLGNPVDQEDYDNWIESLPKQWVTNPALCQIIEVPADIEDAELERIVRKQVRIAKNRAAAIKQVEKGLAPNIEGFEKKWLGLEVTE